MSTAHTDPHVVFEHSLRTEVRMAIARFDAEMVAMDKPHASVSIEYEHSRKDGLWKLHSYIDGSSTSTSGAVLNATMLEHIATIKRSSGLRELPSLLAAPVAVEAAEPSDDVF